jgi:hypothetical protein
MVKYIQRRINGKPTKLYTCIGWCLTCGTPFEKIGKGTGPRKYCEVCAINSNRQNKRNYEKTRPERKEYKRELAVKLRGEGRVIDTREGRSNMVGKPPEEPTDKDWMEYHNKIKKMKQQTMGGYQDYHDIDDDTNPYE